MPQAEGKNRLKIAITVGEPAGIGPDIALLLNRTLFDAELYFITDPTVLEYRAEKLNADFPLNLLDYRALDEYQEHMFNVLPVHMKVHDCCGEPNQLNVSGLMRSLEEAATGCQEGRFDAMVTGPIHKGIINRAGHYLFRGHTEFLAKLTNTPEVVMMLATPAQTSPLRVALVTTHIPLKEVAQQVTPKRLKTTLTLVQQAMQQQFGLSNPRITVCGLNPHAGEQGHLGSEENTTLNPVLEQLREQGYDLTGPIAADTAFAPHQREQADVIVAMYHDQGLAPLKALGFGQAVNITLGLPIIRTSVDHGTALDLAGTGKASPSSLEAAIHMAIDMAKGK